MIKRGDFFALIAVIIVFSYTIAIGATFNGVLTPELHIPTLVMTAFIVVVWLLVHYWHGWVWHRTPLDGVMLLWVAAFGVSLVANLESWRRITIGLWYVSTYIGVWYMLHDIIANEGISRETFIDGLLICGLIVLIFGFLQSRDWLAALPLMFTRTIPLALPRPVSTFGNPNTLANFLVVIIPFAIVRSVSSKFQLSRIIMGLYALAALLLLFLTYSRGAWIGIAVGLAVLGGLLLIQHDMLSWRSLKSVWTRSKRIVRVMVVGAGITGMLVTALILFIFLRSLNQAGRTTDLRTYIYETAIDAFSEKPITGYGLFTFGRELARRQSVPPTTPHSHAHDAPLMIAAELGIIGLAALFSTLAVMIWTAYRNWRDIKSRQRAFLSGAIGCVVAFAVHNLTDIPAMTPAIALTGLVPLALMMTASRPMPLSSQLRRIEHSIVLICLWMVLLVTGFWSSRIYGDYVNALLYATKTYDFRGAAGQIQPTIDADPELSLYYKEQGFLLGLAANNGDMDAAQEGVAVYQKFISREPGYAVVWANMAALQWGLGDRETAFRSMQQAVILAPESWQLSVNLGLYADALGKTDISQEAFEQAIAIHPDITLLSELEKFRSDDLNMSIPARVVFLLGSGNIEQAAKLWTENPQLASTSKYVIEALIKMAQSNQSDAISALKGAEEISFGDTDQAWINIGKARLAQLSGDVDEAKTELKAAYDVLAKNIFEEDFVFGVSTAYAQFMRLGFQRQFLPQVYFPVDDPVLLYVLNKTQEG